MTAVANALIFAEQNKPDQPAATCGLSAFGVSLGLHTLLLCSLYWAGQHFNVPTAPQVIEVMLVEQEAEPLPVTAAPQAPTPPQLAPKPPAPVKSVTPPVKPATPPPASKQVQTPTSDPQPTADIRTGPAAPPPNVSKPVEATPSPASAPLDRAVPGEAKPAASAETSAPRVDAKYAGSNPRPAYPTMARRLGQQGTVTLEVIVTVDGTAKSVRVLESSGFELLDQAALTAISKWRFVPAKRGDQPVEQKLSTRWTYKLEE